GPLSLTIPTIPPPGSTTGAAPTPAFRRSCAASYTEASAATVWTGLDMTCLADMRLSLQWARRKGRRHPPWSTPGRWRPCGRSIRVRRRGCLAVALGAANAAGKPLEEAPSMAFLGGHGGVLSLPWTLQLHGPDVGLDSVTREICRHGSRAAGSRGAAAFDPRDGSRCDDPHRRTGPRRIAQHHRRAPVWLWGGRSRRSKHQDTDADAAPRAA